MIGKANPRVAVFTGGAAVSNHPVTAGMAPQLAQCIAYTSPFRPHRLSTGRQPRLYSSKPTRRSQMAATAATAQEHVPAEIVVQKQLEAYNARDLEAFMDLLADDCVATDAVTGATLGNSKVELRERYKARFQTEVHSELLGRLCLGSVVVDREIITGLPDAQVADCLATYHCEEGKIKKMSFVWQARQQ